MMTTAVDARAITQLDHNQAMQVTNVEFARLLSAVRELDAEDWTRPTDCVGWNVRAVMLHLLGSAEANASLRETAHQMRNGKRLFQEIGGDHWVDGINELQIRERSTVTNEEIVNRYAAVIPKALSSRQRLPRLIRSLPLVDMGEPYGRRSVGFLMDIVYTRDVWMHRVDIARATDRPLVLTPEHDGRIVADIVGEWARVYGHDFTLQLDGPAGGSYFAGAGSEPLRIDAIEFARVLSGRGSGTGLLAYSFPL
jgi:uncharacterized protein (TIGR03083 family)